jgi:hypothetical protein
MGQAKRLLDHLLYFHVPAQADRLLHCQVTEVGAASREPEN